MERESFILWMALSVYVAAGVTAILTTVLGRRAERIILALLVLALVLHGTSIGLRWERLGHGPYLTMFEILSSNIWSLAFIFSLAYWRVPPLRPTACVIMPILFLMMAWMMLNHPGEGHLPTTYNTIWLYIHIILGKIFLGSVLVALGLGGVILLRFLGIGERRLAFMPNDASLDELAYRFMGIGLIFDGLMLVAGAIWAQGAWGRYWAWDPLETLALITWLLLAAAIHVRLTLRPPPWVGAAMVFAVFALAFFTFFGVPFMSQVPHQGAV